MPSIALARKGIAIINMPPMKAAISAYSIAVAPDSSLAKRVRLVMRASIKFVMSSSGTGFAVSCAAVLEPLLQYTHYKK